MSAARDGEGGFTLVELLVVTAILGIVMPVLAAAFALGYKTTTASTAELAASHNRQLIAAYLTEDVQSAVTAEDATSADTTTCMVAGDTLVGRLKWSDVDIAASTARAVTYVLATVGGEQQLIRRSCVALVRSDLVLVHGAVSSTFACLSAAYAAISCTTFAVVRLTASDIAGSFNVIGMARS
jgi:prepilin-type N-terminal cleavage/methylation domain-containing protein